MPPAAKTQETSRRPAKPEVPELPVLEKIENDIIVLNPEYFFKKRYEDVTEAANELPVVIEYINESLQRAAIAANDAKRDLAAMEAETYTALRQDWSTKFAEKMTEKALEMAVLQDKDLAEVARNYSVLKSYVSRLSNMQENLRMKLDMLRSVEATKRKLINDDPD